MERTIRAVQASVIAGALTLRLASALALAVAAVLVAATPAPAMAQSACANHAACDKDSLCLEGSCTNVVGRQLMVRVASASITPNQRDGSTWDCDETPDPYVVVFFPNREELHTTKVLEDTLEPQWQETQEVQIPAGDRAIWFCIFDDDTFGSDDIRVGSEGPTNCVGYKDILDLARLGESRLETQGELKVLTVGAGLK